MRRLLSGKLVCRAANYPDLSGSSSRLKFNLKLGEEANESPNSVELCNSDGSLGGIRIMGDSFRTSNGSLRSILAEDSSYSEMFLTEIQNEIVP